MAGRFGLQSGPAITCMKMLLTVFNIIFWLSGVAILMLGVWMKIELYMYIELTTYYFTGAPYILMGVGAGIILFGSFGCVCTMKGHGRLLYIYVIVLFLVFLAEIGLAVCAYYFRFHIKEGLDKGFDEAMENYSKLSLKRKAVDGLQMNLKCCGKTSYQDWWEYDWSGTGKDRHVPLSCCNKTAGETICNGKGTNDIYTDGCYVRLTEFVQRNFNIIGGVVLGFAFLQLLGTMLTCCLANRINKARYEEV